MWDIHTVLPFITREEYNMLNDNVYSRCLMYLIKVFIMEK
jgi:hypothetical protein